MTQLGPGREFDLIRSVLASRGPVSEQVSVGPGDDAAVVRIEGATVVSTDLTVEGIHFSAEWLDPREVGYRAAASALSDLAAMAAHPVGILLSIAVDRSRAAEWIPAISAGAGEVLDRTGGSLLGGDVSRIPDGGPVVVDVVAMGQTEQPVERNGAKDGDEVWVTGQLGLAALAVEEWGAGRTPDAAARQGFTRPTPRIQEALWLAERVALTSMIDLSDGLVADAGHLAAASGVRLTMNASTLPIAPALLDARNRDDATVLAATGGEDYELLLTAPPGTIPELLAEFEARFQISLSRLGEVTTGAGVGIVGADLSAHNAGHDHFQPEPLA